MQGIEKALGDKRIRAVFGGESESGLEYFRWNLRLFPLFLAFFLVMWGSSFSWGACNSGDYSSSYISNGVGTTPSMTSNGTCGDVCNCVNPTPPFYSLYRNEYFLNCSYEQAGVCGQSGWNGAMWQVTTTKCYLRCDNQCDLDSIACINDGGTWAENPNASCGKSCRTNGCTAADTANINAQKVKCDTLGGTNDLALVNNGAQGCGISGYCNLCNGTSYEKIRKQQQKDCCEQGHAPDTTKLKCIVESIASSEKQFVVVGQNACLSGDPQTIITPDGVTYRKGCDDPPPPTNSSNSGGSSSSESGLSSSSESGGDSLGLEWLKDSTHKIIMYDSTTASNTIDIVNYLYDIKTCLESGTCGNGSPIDYTGDIHEVRDTLHHSNELLKQIADKDLSVQVNGGLTAEKQAELVNNIQYVADSAAKYGKTNGEKLDSIVSALKGMGMDSIAHKLDSMRNDKLDSISGGIYSLDSTFAYWGDSSNWRVDSAGWGGKYDSLKSWGDSLTGAMGDWLEGCDTTGGRHCDNIYIGSHGLDSATSGMKGAAGALRDSMLNGRFADSLNLWASKFNNPKITGSGSNTCPSALTRSYSLNFGSMGEVQMGSFGTYLCEPIFGSVTPWTLGRILLRAIVAISCMWFLFKCATGFKGDSGEED